MGNLGARLGGTEKEQCRERKTSKRSSVFMKGVCGCGRRSPPILVGVRARIDGLRVPSATHMAFDLSVVTPSAIERAPQPSG